MKSEKIEKAREGRDKIKKKIFEVEKNGDEYFLFYCHD